jgi:O-6-methylguanine DNA methyltransferase
MTGSPTTQLDDAALAGQLAGLRTSAPDSLLPRTQIDVGLADAYAAIDSPIGPLFVAFNGLGVSTVEQAPDGPTFERRHVERVGRPAYRVAALPDRLGAAIDRRLSGDRRARIALDLRGRTAFERDVWAKALEIPRGEVRPYGWIATEIGRPRAVRAVGTALGHNPVPLIVPCHRVVRSDGLIGNYSLGGPANKRTILAAEGLDPDELETMARAGIRYIGSDTTKIYCLPSCHAARRIGPSHRVPFRSAGDGDRAGYRACRQCRPTAAAIAA